MYIIIGLSKYITVKTPNYCLLFSQQTNRTTKKMSNLLTSTEIRRKVVKQAYGKIDGELINLEEWQCNSS